MFIGHAALALAAKPLAPRANLGVAWSALALWLLPVWGWWADRHRGSNSPMT